MPEPSSKSVHTYFNDDNIRQTYRALCTIHKLVDEHIQYYHNIKYC